MGDFRKEMLCFWVPEPKREFERCTLCGLEIGKGYLLVKDSNPIQRAKPCPDCLKYKRNML